MIRNHFPWSNKEINLERAKLSRKKSKSISYTLDLILYLIIKEKGKDIEIVSAAKVDIVLERVENQLKSEYFRKEIQFKLK